MKFNLLILMGFLSLAACSSGGNMNKYHFSESEKAKISGLKIDALNKNFSGQEIRWSAFKGDIRGVFTPRETFVKNGVICRKTEEKIYNKLNLTIYYDIYCQTNEQGNWQKLPN